VQDALITEMRVPEEEFLTLERRWNEAHLRGDAGTLEQMCHEGVMVTVPGMAVMARGQAFGVLRSGRMTFRRYETTELRSRAYGNAVVVSGRLQRTRTAGGRTMDDDWRFTKVYVREDRRWQVVAFHASPRAQ
jgi:hypothetical protein